MIQGMIDHLMQFKSFKGHRIDLGEFIEKRWARNWKKSNPGGGKYRGWKMSFVNPGSRLNERIVEEMGK